MIQFRNIYYKLNDSSMSVFLRKPTESDSPDFVIQKTRHSPLVYLSDKQYSPLEAKALSAALNTALDLLDEIPISA